MMSRSSRAALLLLLQIGNFVSLDLGAIGFEGRFVLRRALVAALGRQAGLLLAPQVEIHFLDVVVAVALRHSAGPQQGTPRSQQNCQSHAMRHLLIT